MSRPDAHDDHDHIPVVTRDNEHKVLLGFTITFTFMIVEVIGGIVSGSLALIADAGHMLTDAAALALTYAAFRFGRRAADRKRTFGYLRLEVIAGLVNAITLFAIVAWIGHEAYERFQQPHEILAGPMLLVAVTGLLVNVLVLWILTRGDSEHVNIKGAALHVMGDLLGSVGAIAAAVVIHLTGWTPIDPILSVVVALLILRSAWSLLSKSLHILLEGAPDNAAPEDIERHLMSKVPNLASVHHVHVWLITSGRALASLHVRPTDTAYARAVVRDVERELAGRFSIEHATVAIDWPRDTRDTDETCSLSSRPGSTSDHHDDHDHAHGAGQVHRH
jgi:cobalt-zinc-cadmium efflux system protein